MSSAYETDVETVSPCRDIGSSIRGWSGLERLKVSHANRYTIEPLTNRGYTINSSKNSREEPWHTTKKGN